MRSLRLQKSPTRDFEEKGGNSPDISKGIPQLGMCKFESSQVSQAVLFCSLVFKEFSFLDAKGPPNAGLSHRQKSLERFGDRPGVQVFHRGFTSCNGFAKHRPIKSDRDVRHHRWAVRG